ncbi:MAG: hypothetical protein PVJ98_09125 [Akkermansiaceae bacterium]|jgi:hypothetical protein
MARLIFLFPLLLVLTGCREEKPVSETESPPDPPTKEELREAQFKKAALLNEKQKLLSELNRLISSEYLDPEGKLELLEQKTRAAQSRFQDLRKNHPLLLKLNADLVRWQNEARSSKSAGRPEEAAKAMEKVVETRGKIFRMSQSLPEIEGSREVILENSAKKLALQRELAGSHPEGKKIIERIVEIEAEIGSL